MNNFIAIDFETANGQRSSVCSVGVVAVRDGAIVDSFYSLIKPRPNYYAWFCQEVHGLDYDDTDNAPDFPEVWKQVEAFISRNFPDSTTHYPLPTTPSIPFAAHNAPFDEGCLKAAFAAYEMPYPNYQFCCTCRKSRDVWPEGHHNLDIIAGYCGYDLENHHHALADAEACAVIGIKIL